MKATSKKLTPKQELFVKHYLITKNATESARLSGYKGNDVTLGQVGAENLKKPQIALAIQKEQEKTSKKLEITRESLLKDIQVVKDMALTEEQPQFQAYLKAIEMQAKMLGLNEPDKIDIQGALTINSQVDFGSR